MIVLPNTPIQPLAIRSTSPNNSAVVVEIRSKRVQLSTNGSTTGYISQLEDYLSVIVDALAQDGVSYDKLVVHSASIAFSESIPWQLPTKSKSNGGGVWTLQDEMVVVCCNISLGYLKRSYELMCKYSRDQLQGQDDPKFWVNAFKLLKRAMEYTKFVSCGMIQSPLSETWENSMSFVKFVESSVLVSIQYTFLSKCLWKLNSTEFNIMDDEINYSTLSKVAIFIKSQLLNMIKETRYHKLPEWSDSLEALLKLVNGFIGALVSIQNYKEDKIGVCIGFLNLAVENISKTATSVEDGNSLQQNDDDEDEDDEDNKLKKKFSMFKKKVNAKSQKLKDSTTSKLKKTNKLKININVYNKLPEALQHDYTNLFQLIELLHLKYHLENNNLKFDKIVPQQELINYTPLGRAVPVEVGAWKPAGMTTMASNTTTGGYY